MRQRGKQDCQVGELLLFINGTGIAIACFFGATRLPKRLPKK